MKDYARLAEEELEKATNTDYPATATYYITRAHVFAVLAVVQEINMLTGEVRR